MLQSVRIKNFQSHKDSFLEFGGGVNVIVGASDSGKTSILRALNLVINNKPASDGYINHDGGDCVVELKLDDLPDTIRRERGKKLNTYCVGSEEYKSFKLGVPEDITQFINMSDINIQNQHDKHFLIANNPGEVAQYLNGVVNLKKIDVALSNINSKTRGLNNKLANRTTDLQTAEEELADFYYIDEVEKKLVRYTKVSESIIKIETDIDVLLSIIDDIERCASEKESYSALFSVKDSVDTAITLIDEIKEARQDELVLSSLISSYEKSREKIARHTTTRLEKAQLYKEAMVGMCPLCEQEIK